MVEFYIALFGNKSRGAKDLNEIIFQEESYRIIGAAIEVHTELGNGFAEPVYQEALAIEFEIRGIPYEKEKQLKISYKNRILKKHYQSDFVCYDKIIVEAKALSQLTSDHESQVLNYLKATSFRLGLLINFGESRLVYKRFANSSRMDANKSE